MKRLIEALGGPVKFDIVEEKSTNEHILAKVRGEFFFPNGISRNNRYYPAKLWEKVLNNSVIKERLANRTMFGTVGHGIEITDEKIGEGVTSHIMTDLYIQDGKGIGEAIILNTPAGRVLNTLLRAGSKMCTSSRANGDFASETYNGMDVIEPESYELTGFDFVTDPGFIKAMPSITESLQKDIDYIFGEKKNKDNLNKGDDNMALEQVLENVSKENAKFKLDLERAIDENKSALKEVQELQSKLAKVTSELEVANEAVSAPTKALEEANNKLADLTAKLEIANKAVEAYSALGTVEDLTKSIKESADELKSFRDLAGNPVELDTELTKAIKVLAEYRELGTVLELKTALAKSRKLVEKIVSEEEEERIETISVELKVPADKIKMLLGKGMTEEEIKELLAGLEIGSVEDEEIDGEGSVLDRYNDQDDPREPSKEEKEEERLAMEARAKRENKSSTTSLMERFTRKTNKKK